MTGVGMSGDDIVPGFASSIAVLADGGTLLATNGYHRQIDDFMRESGLPILQSLLPAGVLSAEVDPRTLGPEALPAEEDALIARAVDQRRREFTAGRTLARSLLRPLGHDRPLGAVADGRPDWPAGIVGSIAHCRSLAAVAVARSASYVGIGIDVEPDAPLSNRVVGKIVVEGERAWVQAWSGGVGAAALRVFCAKEAVFKAVYPLALKYFDFADVVLTPSADGEGFFARLEVDELPFPRGTVIGGRWRAHDGHFAAAVVIERP